MGAVLLLLVWGTVDQARYYLALNTDDLQDLQRAAKLDGFDSSLQMRLARKEMEDGEPQQAEAAWRRAVQANPSDPAARQGLLRLLIDQNRDDEAYSLTEASLKYAPKDANLLVDRGFLAVQRGHGDQALASWNEALAVDPQQSLVHLYLADELDREGKAQDAASHYTIISGNPGAAVRKRSAYARSGHRYRVAPGGLPGAFLAAGTGCSVLSPGGKARRADQPAQAREPGGRE